jgi:endonuclease YncB( thermonuclease family)
MFRLLRNSFIALLATATVALAESKWETLNGCKLLANSSNDGDSFHAQFSAKEYIFRLYYVDTPETDDDYPKRVSEQAAYFKVSHEQVLQIGKTAARFTAGQLRAGFTVVTRWDNARGNSKLPRNYAFVIVNGRDLAETLVEQGLARVFGENAIPPKGSSTATVVAGLQR